jgi:hypothetical protein
MKVKQQDLHVFYSHHDDQQEKLAFLFITKESVNIYDLYHKDNKLKIKSTDNNVVEMTTTPQCKRIQDCNVHFYERLNLVDDAEWIRKMERNTQKKHEQNTCKRKSNPEKSQTLARKFMTGQGIWLELHCEVYM